MNIVLFGIKGCGKSTIGKAVAKEQGRAFIDTDALIEKAYQQNHHKKSTCQAIHKEVGPHLFRALEYEVIQSLQDVQRSVIAVGGGAMLLSENVEALKKLSHLIYLFVEKEVLKKRVLAEDPLPYFINPNDPDASFDKMYDARHDTYQKLTTHLVDITALKEEQVVATICRMTQDGKQ